MMGVIADMIRSGADPDLVERMANELADVRVQEARRSASEAIEGRRKADRERQARHRNNVTSRDVTGQNVTVPEPYIARADAPVCSNDISNEISKLDTPDLKVCPPTPEPARSARLILFDRFYAAYPKHTNRKAAEAKFLAAVRNGVDAELIISAAARFAEATRRAMTEKNFIPAPDVWLNRGKWDDEDLPDAVTPQARAGPSQGGGWAKQLVKLEQNAREQPTESSGTVEAIPWLSERKDEGRRADDAHDGGVSRNAVELLVGNSFRRM